MRVATPGGESLVPPPFPSVANAAPPLSPALGNISLFFDSLFDIIIFLACCCSLLFASTRRVRPPLHEKKEKMSPLF